MSDHGWSLYQKIDAELDSPNGLALGLIVETIVKHGEHKESLQKAISYMMDTLNRAEEHLSQDYHVNSLGIIQSQGSEIDRLCGLYEQAATDVKRSMYNMVKLGTCTEEQVAALVEGTIWAKEA